MQFPLYLDATFLKKSYARRMFHGWGKLAIAVVLVLVSTALSAGEDHLSAWSVFGLIAVGLAGLIFGVAWHRQSKAIDDWIRAQGKAPVIYALSEDLVETTSAIGSTKLKWDAFRGMAITDEDTLLLFPHSGALTLPTRQVPSEAIEFLKKRLLAHDKKIKDKRKKPTNT